ncbi:hypothetical protein WOLCODRAFT_18831 [Wolfiporia cocos MD-104 SS10]|uniref:Uncharacterized protein n=1 Tax=Wolfiporia cocos (strain MD-104) TaxID=742152 RepID=A0A2H3JWD2_WOLCO|nr:hypothetical protein WOLCODRAFT_18831 [Wolfiporia cocos MD-104 SS10]
MSLKDTATEHSTLAGMDQKSRTSEIRDADSNVTLIALSAHERTQSYPTPLSRRLSSLASRIRRIGRGLTLRTDKGPSAQTKSCIDSDLSQCTTTTDALAPLSHPDDTDRDPPQDTTITDALAPLLQVYDADRDDSFLESVIRPALSEVPLSDAYHALTQILFRRGYAVDEETGQIAEHYLNNKCIDPEFVLCAGNMALDLFERFQAPVDYVGSSSSHLSGPGEVAIERSNLAKQVALICAIELILVITPPEKPDVFCRLFKIITQGTISQEIRSALARIVYRTDHCPEFLAAIDHNDVAAMVRCANSKIDMLSSLYRIGDLYTSHNDLVLDICTDLTILLGVAPISEYDVYLRYFSMYKPASKEAHASVLQLMKNAYTFYEKVADQQATALFRKPIDSQGREVIEMVYSDQDTSKTSHNLTKLLDVFPDACTPVYRRLFDIWRAGFLSDDTTPCLCEPARRACEAVLALSAHLSDDEFGHFCVEPKKIILEVINERAEKQDWFSVWTILYDCAYLAESRTDATRFFTDDVMRRLAYLRAYCDPYHSPEVRTAVARIRLAVNST